MTTAATTNQQAVFVSTALHAWEQSIKRATAFFDACTDADLDKPILPGKNRIVYLLGHLTAVHDRMLPLLGLGECLFPDLDPLFLSNPDDPAAAYPAAAELRKSWTAVNDR